MANKALREDNDNRRERCPIRRKGPRNALEPRHVLILTANTGLGHRITAQAIASALEVSRGQACVVNIVNPMDDARAPQFLREGQADYDKAVREMPDLYQLGYQMSDVPLAVAIMETGLTVMLSEIMQDVLQRYQPDVIVTTHQNYLAPLKTVFEANDDHIPLLTVVTDLATVHQMWFNNVTDLCLVPNELVREQAIKYGLPPEKIVVTGVPVSPEIVAEHRDAERIRRQLGWREDLKTVLVVGGKRVANLADALRVLNHSALPLQLVIVAGGDDELYQRLLKTNWHVPVHFYNFVDNMPTLMHAADCVICKAGGLIVTEALACGLPLLLFGVIPGQETGNANYVVKNGAAELAQNALDVLDIMSHWFQDGGVLLAQRAHNARSLGRPRAAYQVADAVWAATEQGVPSRPRKLLGGLVNLRDWLNQFDALLKREFGPEKSRDSSNLSGEES